MARGALFNHSRLTVIGTRLFSRSSPLPQDPLNKSIWTGERGSSIRPESKIHGAGCCTTGLPRNRSKRPIINPELSSLLYEQTPCRVSGPIMVHEPPSSSRYRHRCSCIVDADARSARGGWGWRQLEDVDGSPGITSFLGRKWLILSGGSFHFLEFFSRESF